jgi:hypothetical protein
MFYLLLFHAKVHHFVLSESILWLRHYTTSRKIAGSITDEAIDFLLPIYLILPAVLGPGISSVSNRNEYHEQRKTFL